MDDLKDWLEENIHIVGMGAFLVTGLVICVVGYGKQFQESQAKNTLIGVTNEYQKKAERVYFMEDETVDQGVEVRNKDTGKSVRRGCSAQVLDKETRTTALMDGKVVIDPLSVTENNPGGNPFNGGFVCGSDGSVFTVNPGGKITLLGTSNKVRDDLVATGAIASAMEMERYAKSVYDRAKQNQEKNPQPTALIPTIVNPVPSVTPAPVVNPYESTTNTTIPPNGNPRPEDINVSQGDATNPSTSR